MKPSLTNKYSTLIVLFIVSVTISLTYITASAQIMSQTWYKPDLQRDSKPKFKDIQKSFNDFWKDKTPGKGTGWKQFKRWEAFWEPRLYLTGEFPNAYNIYQEWQTYLANDKNKHDNILAESKWTFLGPTNKPVKPNQSTKDGIGMGRMNCIAFDPSNQSILWAGAAYGGVWKSIDGGDTWTTFPFTEFLSIGITDIAVSPSNPQIVYAATGDADGSLSGNACYSIGVIKTTDGGNTWALSGMQHVISDGVIIYRLLVHPTNPLIVYAATSQGLFTTTDGGANWNKLYDQFFRDMVFKPGNPDTFYGAVVTIGSTGDTVYAVVKCVLADGKCYSNIAYSTHDCKRIALAVTSANPEYVYAITVASDLGFLNVIRSKNSGDTWDVMAQRSSSPNYLSEKADGSTGVSQGHYDLCIAVSPTIVDEVYIGGVNAWKSTNGGKDWFIVAEWTGTYSTPWVHADHHALKFAYNNILYSCNDGGVQKTTNGGGSWTDISNGLAVTQFYRISSAKTSQGVIYGGTQDNGTHRLLASTWQNVLGGDGMDCAIDPVNLNIVYASLYYGDFYKSTDGGVTFGSMINRNITQEYAGWVTPLLIDPSNNRTIYAGYQNLWKSVNSGANWAKISSFTSNYVITALAIAPSNSNIIYVGKPGEIDKTTDGGQTWTQIIKGGNVSSIAIDPKNPNRIWFCNSGYGDGQKTFFYDGNLVNTSGTLPNVPVNCIVYQTDSPDGVYIATDLGVFYRDSRMNDWQNFNSGLPNVVVNDLVIHYASKKIRAATFGRGLWENDIISCTGTIPSIQAKGKTDICEGDSVRLEIPESYSTYNWSNGSTTYYTWVNTSGNYTVTVTDDKNCSYTSQPFPVTVHSTPNIGIRIDGDTTFCKGDSVTLTVYPWVGYSTFLWSNNATGKTVVVRESGNYTVIGATKDSCKRTSNSVIVTAYDLPEKPVITQSNDTIFCSTTGSAYQWYYNDNLIINANKSYYKFVKLGKYTVKVTNEHSCSNLSDPIDIANGVNDSETSAYYLKIEPNPSPGIFTLETNSSNTEKFDLLIYNVQGKTVFESRNNLISGIYRKQIDLQKLPNGIYFVNVYFNDRQLLKKLIKE